MGNKVESFQSADGVLFGSEYEMLVHEATSALVEEFPQLKMQIPFIIGNVDRIAEILQPIGSHNRALDGSHTVAQVVEQNRGMIRQAIFGPSRKPRWGACSGQQG